ncbi:hypothetical protein ACQ4PT_018290 [Festuca glaucescens]
MAEGRKFEYPENMTDDEIAKLGVLVSENDRPLQLPLPRNVLVQPAASAGNVLVKPPTAAGGKALVKCTDAAGGNVLVQPPPAAVNVLVKPPAVSGGNVVVKRSDAGGGNALVKRTDAAADNVLVQPTAASGNALVKRTDATGGDAAALGNSTIEVTFIFDYYTVKLEGGSEVLVPRHDIVVEVNPKVIQVSDLFDMVIKKIMMGHGQVAKFFWYCAKTPSATEIENQSHLDMALMKAAKFKRMCILANVGDPGDPNIGISEDIHAAFPSVSPLKNYSKNRGKNVAKKTFPKISTP